MLFHRDLKSCILLVLELLFLTTFEGFPDCGSFIFLNLWKREREKHNEKEKWAQSALKGYSI